MEKKKALIWHFRKNFATNVRENLDGHCIFDVKYLDSLFETLFKFL